MATPLAPRPRRLANPVVESVRVLGLYVRAQFIISVSLTVLYAAGFALARVPWWPLIALVSGVASIVPRIGAVVPILLAGLANLLGDRNLNHFLIALAVWIAIQALEGFLLTPRLLGKPLGLKPWLVFVALLAGSFLFGPIGLLLAIPVLAVAGVFYRYFRDRPT